MGTVDGQVSRSASAVERNMPSYSGKAWKPVDTCRGSSSSSSSGGLNNLTTSPKQRDREKATEVADAQARGSFFSWAGPTRQDQMDECKTGESVSVCVLCANIEKRASSCCVHGCVVDRFVDLLRFRTRVWRDRQRRHGIASSRSRAVL